MTKRSIVEAAANPKTATLGNMLLLDLNEYFNKGFEMDKFEYDHAEGVLRIVFKDVQFNRKEEEHV